MVNGSSMRALDVSSPSAVYSSEGGEGETRYRLQSGSQYRRSVVVKPDKNLVPSADRQDAGGAYKYFEVGEVWLGGPIVPI